MSLAELDLDSDGPVVCAHLRGDIDMSNAAELREELSRRTPNHALGLVLDLREVHYLDSAGIHLVHHLREDFRASGLGLRLVIPADSPINDTLRLAGLNWHDETAETVDAARRALEASD